MSDHKEVGLAKEAKDIKKPFHEMVAEQLIEQLRAGTAPWQRPWVAGEPRSAVPLNPVTGKRYKGINAIFLMSQGRSDARWMTYKQAASVDAQVRKGERGTPIQYWKFSEEHNKLDEQGRPVLDAQGEPVKVTVMLERPRVFFATVFNAEQIDGLPVQAVVQPTWDPLERSEALLKASGAVIRHGESNRAYYRSSTDSIHLPDPGQFPSADRYYATALHELGHWSGHESRLGRDLANPFGSEAYAREELRAEIASMILGDELGIGHDPGQHASYVASWIQVLQDDPLEVFRAAADAEKIHDFVLAFEQQLQQAPQPVIQGAETGDSAAVTNITATTNGAQPLPLTREQALQRWESLLDRNTNGFSPSDPARAQGLADAGATPQRLENFWDEVRHLSWTHQWGQSPWESAASVAASLQTRAQGPSFVHAGGDVVDLFLQAVQAIQTQQPDTPMTERTEISSTAPVDKATAALALLEDADMRARVDRASRETGREAEIHAQEEAQKRSIIATDRTPLQVPFKEKDEAKALGARWDRQAQTWYAPPGRDLSVFARWTPAAAATTPANSQTNAPINTTTHATNNTPTEAGSGDTVLSKDLAQETARVYLAVPYHERNAAKAVGARWDKVAKSWYVSAEVDPARIDHWLPDKVALQQAPALSPREEFGQALRAMGCVVTGEHPIMDGQKHRIAVNDDKPSEKAGFYVGYLDGHPAGYIKNNRSGEEMTWRASGQRLNDTERAQMQAQVAQRAADREVEVQQQHLEASVRVQGQWEGFTKPEQPTAYLLAKGLQTLQVNGVDLLNGVRTDTDSGTTCIRVHDANDQQWSTQYIQADGTKRFAKGARKEGCFHALGGMAALAQAPVLLIAEGYATAASLAQASGHATVAAFDAGNLEAVAKALQGRFADKPVVIAGDDDRVQELSRGRNPGRNKAEEAAQAVAGHAVIPIFAPGEQAREPKRFSDFNDMAQHSQLGLEGVRRQISVAVLQAAQQQERRQQAKALEQSQAHSMEPTKQQRVHSARRSMKVG
jgi:putative DNA primase/helicase